jgi:hypothetical protein
MFLGNFVARVVKIPADGERQRQRHSNHLSFFRSHFHQQQTAADSEITVSGGQ